MILLAKNFDHEELLKVYNSLPFESHQIHVSSPDGSTYIYESGDLSKTNLDQNDFTKLNKLFKDTYVEEVYNSLDKEYDICRGRFMRLDPIKPNYTYHYDISNRLHIPLQTNDMCYFMENGEEVKMQTLGQLYELETTYEHTAFNTSNKPRVHFVVCRKTKFNINHYAAKLYG